MQKTYRPYDRDQLFLLPPCRIGWHRTTSITTGYEQELRGYPPYHPRMMTTLL